jgi:predicted nucleic acid-binding protein
MDLITDTRVRIVGKRVEFEHHRMGEDPVLLTFGAGEAESIAYALATKAAEARAAEREARPAAEPAE